MKNNENFELKSLRCVEEAIIEELYIPILLRNKITPVVINNEDDNLQTENSPNKDS